MHPSITERKVPPHEFRSWLLNFTRQARTCPKTTIFSTELLQRGVKDTMEAEIRTWHHHSRHQSQRDTFHLPSGSKAKRCHTEEQRCGELKERPKHNITEYHLYIRKMEEIFHYLRSTAHQKTNCVLCCSFSLQHPEFISTTLSSHFSKRKRDQQSQFIVFVYVYHTYTNTMMWSLAWKNVKHSYKWQLSSVLTT